MLACGRPHLYVLLVVCRDVGPQADALLDALYHCVVAAADEHAWGGRGAGVRTIGVLGGMAQGLGGGMARGVWGAWLGGFGGGQGSRVLGAALRGFGEQCSRVWVAWHRGFGGEAWGAGRRGF